MGMEVRALPGRAPAGIDSCNQFSFLYEYPHYKQAGWKSFPKNISMS